ncbi:MAG: ABC transporter permease [Dehalococcoidia bacterium]
MQLDQPQVLRHTFENRTPRRSWFHTTFRSFRRDSFALVAACILLVIIILSIVAPLVAPYDPTEAEPNLRLLGMGTPGHLFGLDGQGRDILSRVIWGGRASFPTALIPVMVATLVSVTLALLSGYFGGILGNIIMRVIDVIFAFPTIILAIAISAFLGTGRGSVIVAVSIVLLPPMTRVAYVAAREQVSRDFVEAARALGAPAWRLMLMHILPNAFPPVLVYATTLVGLMVVFVAGLSFLGLGLKPPTAEWGLMVAEGRQLIGVAPHVAVVPGLTISITALCFNLIGDGLRYALDPRVRNIK